MKPTMNQREYWAVVLYQRRSWIDQTRLILLVLAGGIWPAPVKKTGTLTYRIQLLGYRRYSK